MTHGQRVYPDFMRTLQRPTPSSARLALTLLLAVYVLNFVDRSILGILAPAIRKDLHLSDTQLGLLGGTAFAIFYTALGIPIGRLADRYHRVRIVTGALALWSLFSSLTGLAQSFLQLFLARLGVGIGEAGGVAPSYSIISDYFPAQSRARALSVYSFGIPIGSAAGLLFGGLMATRVNWRTPLVIVGAIGLLFAPWFLRSVAEPARGGLDAGAPSHRAGVPALTAREPATGYGGLFGKLSFWSLALGGAVCSLPGYGLLFWLPSFFVRSYGFTLPQVSCYLAALTLIGGVIGLWSGGWLSDRLGGSNPGAYALVPAVAFLLCVPFYALGVAGTATAWRLLLFLVPTALSLAWLGPTICAVQHLVRADHRAFAASALLFVINLIGLGLGSAIIGRLSDHFAARYGPESLRHAILAVTGFYVLAAALFAISAVRLREDWRD